MLKRWPFSAAAMLLILLCIPQFAAASGVTVLTVPWVPTNPTSPHTTYPCAGTSLTGNCTSSTAESLIVLGATAPSEAGSGHTLSVDWSFGDGSPDATFTTSNPYDLSTTHQYPASAGAGTTWTATVTVTDETTLGTGSAHYDVIQSANNLPARVNVALDWGLWYMHQTMWRSTSGSVNIGGWDTNGGTCPTVGGTAYDCSGNAVIDAENVQAFEVSGHVASGPSTDPFTDDVARGVARMFMNLTNESNVSQTYQFNPATTNYRCSTSTPGLTVNPMYISAAPSMGSTTYPYCPTSPASSAVYFNSSATSCTSPPCAFTFDGNSNNQMIYSNDAQGETVYTTGPYIDSLVAGGTPTATAPTGTAAGGGLPGILGQTYQNIVQDMADWYGACQYEYDYDVGNGFGVDGYSRGYGGSNAGGGWLYTCQTGDDNSTSQWGAIGLIGAYRGFGIAIPQVVKDMNNTWVTNSQANETGDFPTGTDSYAAGDDDGSFGYRGDIYNSNAWGPFATTPSGGVQMVLDDIGRTTNTAFGDGSTAADQRWNNYETFYADNFCNNPSSGATEAPRDYTYGMFSFTKSMLLHDPAGALTPIQYLRTKTPGVFTTNPSVPANSIDWYAGLSAANGGQDPCDGVAQTLVGYQAADGSWTGHDYYAATPPTTGYQTPFETAWSIIMLQKTVFVSCINNLYGRGTPGNALAKPRIDLTWSAQTNATSYAVFRGTTTGGPYTQIGTSTIDGYSDRGGTLVNGGSYYYVVQPINGTAEICQSNEEKVTIP